MNVWILLTIAGLLEVGWAISLKFTNGFTKLTPSIIAFVAMAGSVYFLALATKKVDLSVAYSIWVAIGVVGTAILGTIIFQESFNLWKAFFILIIITGVIGLKYSS